MPKGNWHPSRISNQQKMLRQRSWEEFAKKPKRPKIEPVDYSKPDWSKEL